MQEEGKPILLWDKTKDANLLCEKIHRNFPNAKRFLFIGRTEENTKSVLNVPSFDGLFRSGLEATRITMEMSGHTRKSEVVVRDRSSWSNYIALAIDHTLSEEEKKKVKEITDDYLHQEDIGVPVSIGEAVKRLEPYAKSMGDTVAKNRISYEEMGKPNADFLKIDNIVNTRDDIELPHYGLSVGGHKISLPMQENIDSNNYRNGLLETLVNAFDRNRQMRNLVESVKPGESLEGHDGGKTFATVRGFMRNIQEQYDDKVVLDKMAEKYGKTENLVEVVSVNMERGKAMVRLNYESGFNEGYRHKGIMLEIPMNNRYTAERDNKQEAFAEYLEVFGEEYAKNKDLQGKIQKFQKECFLRYEKRTDLVADKGIASEILGFADRTADRTHGIVRRKQEEKKRQLDTIQKRQAGIKKKVDALDAEQAEIDKGFWGFGKYVDRLFHGRERFSRKADRDDLMRMFDSYQHDAENAVKPSKTYVRLKGEIRKAYDNELALLARGDTEEKGNLKKPRTVANEKGMEMG